MLTIISKYFFIIFSISLNKCNAFKNKKEYSNTNTGLSTHESRVKETFSNNQKKNTTQQKSIGNLILKEPRYLIISDIQF